MRAIKCITPQFFQKRSLFAVLFALFISSIYLLLSCQPTYAGTGYLTGDINDFDGFINSNPFYTNSWPGFTVYGNKNSYNGFSGNLPQLCKAQNSNSVTNCNSNYTQGGNNYNTWTVGKLSTPSNGWDIKGIEKLYLNNSFEVPNDWKGKKIALTLYLGFYEQGPIDPDTGALTYTNHVPTWVELNWGAVTLVNRGSSNTCNDLITNRFVTTDVSENDFVVFELDYSNVTKDTVCYLTPQWSYGGDVSHGYLYYSNFDASYTVVVHNPYVGWDIIEESNEGMEGLVDDWKEQQGQEWDEQKDIINNNGSSASNTASQLNLQFTVLNVFTGWFGLFTGNNCVDIPVMANMIHVTNSHVCSPWSNSVRAVTSPVLATFGSVILSFFIYRWLMKREDQEIT